MFLEHFVHHRAAEMQVWIDKLESGIIASDDRKREFAAMFFQRILRGEMVDEAEPTLKAAARESMKDMAYNAKRAVFQRFVDRCGRVGM